MLMRDVIGQTDAKNQLIQMALNNRVSHALLFSGSKGTGALPLALAFTQFIFCSNKSENDSCNECLNCRKIKKMEHADVSYSFPVVTKKSGDKPKSVDFIQKFRTAVLGDPYLNYFDWITMIGTENKQGIIPVEEASDISRRITLHAVEGGFKIVLMWMAEKMNHHTQNKMLKLLEEPPDNTLFFLVTEQQELLFSTILSRTQLIKLKRISDYDLQQVLVEKHNAAPIKAKKIVHLAEGSYTEARSIAVEEESPDEDHIEIFLEWMRACLKMNAQKIFEFSVQMHELGKEQQKAFIGYALSIARECLLFNHAGNELMRLDENEFSQLQKFFPFIHFKNATLIIDALNSAVYHLERNANTKILFTNLSLKMYQYLHIKP